jgi:hypothetical protein
MKNQITENQLTASLDEIFMVPSREIRTERFSPEKQASSADCSGKCNGVCHGMA